MRLLSSCLYLLLLLSGATHADIQSDLLSRLNQIKTVSAQFVQETRDQSGAVVNASKGQLTVGEGARFNVQSEEPFPQQLISDGEDLYNYDVELEQVVVQPLVKDATQVPILLLGNADPNVLEQYQVERLAVSDDAKETEVFELKARNPASVIEWITLTFVSGLPNTISLKDSLGQSTQIQLESVALNPEVEAGVFLFELPDGVDLIDDR